MKRKLHNAVYYQCDYTGFLMSKPNCYMPYLVEGKRKKADGTIEQVLKLKKRGNYCNWEAVLQHARQLFGEDKMSEDEYTYVINTVRNVLGLAQLDVDSFLQGVPLYTELEHFGGTYDVSMYHDACCRTASDSVQTVNIAAAQIEPSGIEPKTHVLSTDTFPTVETRPIVKAKDVRIFSEPADAAPLNKFASTIFKTHLHGDVQVVRFITDTSFKPRSRLVDYSVEEFSKDFLKKRKRGAKKETDEHVYVEVAASTTPPTGPKRKKNA